MKLFKGPVPTKPWRKSASVIIAAPREYTATPGLCNGLNVQNQADYRICMLKRHGKSSFMGNAVVFPGGAYDAVDEVVGGEDVGKACAAREAFEEAGAGLFDKKVVVGKEWRKKVHSDGKEYLKMMEEYGVKPDFGKMYYWCKFITPDVEAARVKKGGFETEFYVAVVDGETAKTLSCDRQETTELIWFTPQECLAAHAASLIYLPPPQWTIMTELAASVTSLQTLPSYSTSPSRALTRDHPIKPYLLGPSPEGVLTMAYPGDRLHPIYPTPTGTRRISIKKSGITMDCDLPPDTRIEMAKL